jgi:hypothetical protein
LFFKNLEEVKKVIRADADTGKPVEAAAGKTMGFDCIKLIHISHMSQTQTFAKAGPLNQSGGSKS